MDGIIVLLKPPGMTSSNAVYDVRRIFSEKRAGHTGTLDPGAAGVLPICIGRATKLFDCLVEKEKSYTFELLFGARTDTQDAYGRVVETMECWEIAREDVERVLPAFLGKQAQTAPVYSALKVDGRKMYDLARAGETVEPRVREIEIRALTLREQTGRNRFLLDVRCTRGTYVRTLAEDIGRRLGVPAYLTFLLRTASGPFTLERAHTVAELEERKLSGTLAETVVTCEEALSFLPSVTLPPERRQPTVNGLDTFLSNQPDGDVRVYCGGFLGVGRVEHRRLRLAVHLY